MPMTSAIKRVLKIRVGVAPSGCTILQAMRAVVEFATSPTLMCLAILHGIRFEGNPMEWTSDTMPDEMSTEICFWARDRADALEHVAAYCQSISGHGKAWWPVAIVNRSAKKHETEVLYDR